MPGSLRSNGVSLKDLDCNCLNYSLLWFLVPTKLIDNILTCNSSLIMIGGNIIGGNLVYII